MRLLISFCVCFQLLMTQSWAYDCLADELKILDKENLSSIEKLDKGIKCKSDNKNLIIGEAITGCIVELAKGIGDYIVKNLEDIASLLGIAYDLAAKFGSFAVDYLMAVWNGTEAIFWAEQYIQGDKFFTGLANSLKMIPEIIVNQFETQIENFNCLSGQKKVEYVCHAITFVGPDVVLGALGAWKLGGTLTSKIGPRISRMISIEKSLLVNADKALTVSAVAQRTIVVTAKSAIDVKKASKLESLAKSISYHPRPRAIYEFEKAGKIVSKADDLKNLDDGPYLFIVDSKGNLAVSPRYPNLTGEGEVLVGHPALKKQLDTLGNNQVSSPGEFFVDGGVVTEINNKSGRFWGTAAHLDLGVETLKAKGLEIPKGVRIKDIETVEKEITEKLLKAGKNPQDDALRKSLRDPEHHEEKEIATFIIDNFKKDKILAKEFEDYKLAYRKLAQSEKFKSSKLGEIDFDKSFDRLIEYTTTHPDSDDVLMAVSYYVSNVTNESARHFKGFKGLMQFPKKTRDEALKLIQEMAKE